MNWLILCQQLLYGLEIGVVYVLVTLGLNLAFGVMGIINLAHGELCMLGAMLVYTLMSFLGFPFFLAVPLSIASTAAFGFVVNRVAVRPLIEKSPLSVLLATIALSFIMVHTGYFIWGPSAVKLEAPFAQAIQLSGICMSGQDVMLFIVGVITVTATFLFFRKARLGKLISATAQNSVGARLVGINVNRMYDYTMIIAAGLGAVAGIFLLPISSTFPGMGQSLLAISFAIVIMGGMGSIKGCVIVGLIMGITEALFGQFVSMYYRLIFIYGIMIIVLMLKPEGLFAR